MSRILQLRLDQIRLDGMTQMRVEPDPAIAGRYAEIYRRLKAEAEAAARRGEVFRPTVIMPLPDVFWDGRFYWMADGFHRHSGMRQARLIREWFKVFDGSQRDAFLHAAGCNSEHGKQRTSEDVRYCIRRMLLDKEWQRWPNNEIARQCHCDPHTVAKEKRQLWEETHPHSERAHSDNETKCIYTTKHGTTAVMDTSKIGKNGSSRERPVPRINAAKFPGDFAHEQGRYERARKKPIRNAKALGMSWEEYVADIRPLWDLIPVVE